MKPLKIVGLVLLVLLLSIGSCVGAIFWATHGVVKAADQFIARCAGGGDDCGRLRGVRAAHWNERSVENGAGRVAGTVILADGREAQVALSFQKHDGKWEPARVSLDGDAPPMPSDAELTKMAHAALTDFADAVAAKDFSAFWSKTAKMWQAQVTATELQKIFQAFVDAQPPLDVVRKTEPVFEKPPAVDDKGVLRLAGYVPAPRQVGFQLGYVYEHPSWKLMSITVSMKRE